MFFVFVANLLLLMVLGAKHVESPYIEIGQIATVFYFMYFIVILPLSSLFENSINEFYTQVKNENKKLIFYKSSKTSSMSMSGSVLGFSVAGISLSLDTSGFDLGVMSEAVNSFNDFNPSKVILSSTIDSVTSGISFISDLASQVHVDLEYDVVQDGLNYTSTSSDSFDSDS